MMYYCVCCGWHGPEFEVLFDDSHDYLCPCCYRNSLRVSN